jgi:hypothetical protein
VICGFVSGSDEVGCCHFESDSVKKIAAITTKEREKKISTSGLRENMEHEEKTELTFIISKDFCEHLNRRR